MEILKSLGHPDEVLALMKFKFGGCDSISPKDKDTPLSPSLKRCYEFLNMTSRSFAAVIQALDGELRHAVCIFYLVLRALDTVEDDMSIPIKTKVPMLKAFHKHLYEPDWKFMDSKEKDYIVLEEFPKISAEFRNLAPIYQDVIADICKKMGEGMTVYLEGNINSLEQWDKYCHYVAGLVGIGLSQLFSASGLEDEIIGKDTDLSNSMGLFLQKTNIIRDYLEDVLDTRFFWPKEVWGKYGEKQGDLLKPEKSPEAMACLNELITNALQHIPDVIEYMSRIKNQSVFNFCAIPQVMAIGTLERCYNNYAVFTGVVKIRKGEAVRMMMEATNIESMKGIMYHFSQKICDRIPQMDPSVEETEKIITRSLKLNETSQVYTTASKFWPLYMSGALTVSAILWQYWTNIASVYSDMLAENQK